MSRPRLTTTRHVAGRPPRIFRASSQAARLGTRIPASWLDPDGVEDGLQLGEVTRRQARGSFRRDHEAGPLDIEDPELLAVAGTRVAAERLAVFVDRIVAPRPSY